MKKLLLAFSLFFTTPAFAAEITSKIVDSVQLSVQGAAVQSNRVGAQYTVSGTNINVTTLGGVGGADVVVVFVVGCVVVGAASIFIHK